MTRRPPAPLDAEERELAALLPRAPGRGEPDAAVDARILAAAHVGLQTPRPAGTRVRRRPIAAMSVAASLVLAMGLAWQLRPGQSPAGSEPAAASASDAAEPPVAAQMIEAPPPSASQPSPMRADTQDASPAPVEYGRRAQANSQVAPIETEVLAAEAPPPPPPPAAPAPVILDTPRAVEASPVQASASARAASPSMAKATGATEAMRERAAGGNTAAQAQDAAARAAADTRSLDTVTVLSQEEPDEDVPPATADSPEVRDAWLRRIGELMKAGKTEDAKASLGEFRRRYPDATLPPELRKLEP